MNLDGKDILAAVSDLPHIPHTYGCTFAPTVDEVELSALPWELRDAGQFNLNVSLLMGFNKDEGTIGVAVSLVCFLWLHF